MEERSLVDIVREEQAEGGYIIRDDVDAERTLKKLAALRAERKEYIESLQERIKEVNARFDREDDFFNGVLREYFDRVEHRKTKTAETYTLANGTIKLTHQAPEYARDASVMIPWLKKNAPEYIKVTESIDWENLKKKTKVVGGQVVLADTAELIEGVTLVQREDKFTITLKGAES